MTFYKKHSLSLANFQSFLSISSSTENAGRLDREQKSTTLVERAFSKSTGNKARNRKPRNYARLVHMLKTASSAESKVNSL
ncbi:MAG: hypothetical protein OQK09_07285 [Colwellia sp.]|nr:hypothetical protein [Colwellia sp.]MCW8865225.1 hypothetical protein [Colwellia sp.]MCW9081301.1 hypothetical protein [Colwellia sp.]